MHLVKKTLLHISEAPLTEECGMGRVSWHWKKEFERRGFEFVHIGPLEVGPVAHKAMFPFAAYRACKGILPRVNLLLVHEPISGAFVNCGKPLVVFSHGLERRGWNCLRGNRQPLRLRTRFTFPLWRLRQCDRGIRRASAVLLINREDAEFAENRYSLDRERTFIFRNGVYKSERAMPQPPKKQCRILFLGSWIARKGTQHLAEAARQLTRAELSTEWVLAGTGRSPDAILREWPQELHRYTKIIPSFRRFEEEAIYAGCAIFVLPSLFEGQPLSLLQAMEAGLCCITSNCCGQKDLITHRFNGMLYTPGNSIELAASLKESISDGALRKRLGGNAGASVENRTWNIVSGEVVDFIESALVRFPEVG